MNRKTELELEKGAQTNGPANETRQVTWKGRKIRLGAGETVLAGLLRAGEQVPYMCQGGNCHSCMMRAVEGEPGKAARRGLDARQQAQGAFLPCLCRPETDLDLRPMIEAPTLTTATVMVKTWLAANMLRLRLLTKEPLHYQPGQFVNLYADNGLTRSYSVASVPALDGEEIELHVRQLPGGQVSSWLHETLEEGDELRLQGPFGRFHYTPEAPDQPLMMIGTGSGLAPLWGILRDALHQGHNGPVYLYHGSREADGLYLVDELRALADAHPGQLHYVPCISGEQALPGCRAGRASDTAFADHPALEGWRLFLCGNPDMVNEARRRGFMAGVEADDIHTDPFILSPAPPARRSSSRR